MSRRKLAPRPQPKKLAVAAAELVTKIKQTEDRVYEVVKRVIDDADPESLLKLGCPEDEYDPVSRRIAEAIVREGVKKLTTTELANIVAFCLHMSFGMWSRPTTLHSLDFDIARKLASSLPDLK